MGGKRDEFLRSQKILRLATTDKTSKTPHVVPVWYMYGSKKFYIGTNTRTQKARNIKKNKRVSFCIDTGVNSPNIYGVMGQGRCNLITDGPNMKRIAKKILLRYFKTLNGKSAKELLDDTDCVIEIIPEKLTVWSY